MIEYTPNPDHRRLVESTSGIGLPYNEIAALINVDEETLFEHYRREIEIGQAKANGQIAKAIYNKALDGDSTSLKLWTENQTKIKRNVGRPLGTKMIGRPPTMLAKTDHQKINELKKMLLDGAGELVVNKAIEIAMNDNHPAQAAMIKLCMDRTLPVSLFEKDRQHRSAVTINITGLGAVVEPAVIDAENITDV
tara:strand:+ start:462 stop:1043 length:582 start_codon:yes stop_codon:yes gene_type:complete